MPLYQYKARQSPTEIIDGVIEADNETSVISRLKNMGLYPVSIVRQEDRVRKSAGIPSLKMLAKKLSGVKQTDVTVFTRQLADLIKAGIPLLDALGILISQSENRFMKSVIEGIKESVQKGSSFSESLSKHKNIFSLFYINMVKSGELGGVLDQVLDRLAGYKEKEDDLKSQVRSALAYPIMLVIVGAVTIFVLTSFVIPRFVSMFTDLGQMLPLPTLILIGVSSFMYNYWWLVLGVIALIVFGLGYIAKRPKGKIILDTIALKIPIWGQIVEKNEISKFTRTLGVLLENGVPILTGLAVSADTVSNGIYSKEITGFREGVSKGEKLGVLIRRSKFFPAMVHSLVSVGEESGGLEEMLLRVSDSFEVEIDRRIKTLVSLIEPVIILIIGSIVGLMVMAILLPIFQIELA